MVNCTGTVRRCGTLEKCKILKYPHYFIKKGANIRPFLFVAGSLKLQLSDPNITKLSFVVVVLKMNHIVAVCFRIMMQSNVKR
jgi:hypothetical protein